MSIAFDLSTTGGEWIVKLESNNQLTICLYSDERHILAIIPPNKDGSPNYGDASLMAASKELLDALIAIHELVNGSKETFSVDAINEPISVAFEKIHAEADV